MAVLFSDKSTVLIAQCSMSTAHITVLLIKVLCYKHSAN